MGLTTNCVFIHSFPPIAHESANRLILGSIPGKASLAANQYYAHPRNLFWPLICSILDIKADSYETRCQGLLQCRIALWDVLKSCTRSSSLDADIVESSIVPNDFSTFLTVHSGIEVIFFNGAMAEKMYLRNVLPHLPEQLTGIRLVRLPSTSPANASISYEEKRLSWQQVRAETGEKSLEDGSPEP